MREGCGAGAADRGLAAGAAAASGERREGAASPALAAPPPLERSRGSPPAGHGLGPASRPARGEVCVAGVWGREKRTGAGALGRRGRAVSRTP